MDMDYKLKRVCLIEAKIAAELIWNKINCVWNINGMGMPKFMQKVITHCIHMQ